MGRACIPAIVALCAGLAFGAVPASARQAPPLLPTGGTWQSIPYQAEGDAEIRPAKTEIADAGKRQRPDRPRAAATPHGKEKARVTAKAAKPSPKAGAQRAAQPKRHPVAAAAVPEQAPRATAAARTKELERRLDVLMPGTKLGTAIEDKDNPSWRRARPGRPAGESNSLSLPFDDKGHAGFLARGYHARPDVQNPHGNTGATFGLRQKF
jgi:hypothetical protein